MMLSGELMSLSELPHISSPGYKNVGRVETDRNRIEQDGTAQSEIEQNRVEHDGKWK